MICKTEPSCIPPLNYQLLARTPREVETGILRVGLVVKLGSRRVEYENAQSIRECRRLGQIWLLLGERLARLKINFESTDYADVIPRFKLLGSFAIDYQQHTVEIFRAAIFVDGSETLTQLCIGFWALKQRLPQRSLNKIRLSTTVPVIPPLESCTCLITTFARFKKST